MSAGTSAVRLDAGLLQQLDAARRAGGQHQLVARLLIGVAADPWPCAYLKR